MDVRPTFYSREASAASAAAFKRRFWKLTCCGPQPVGNVRERHTSPRGRLLRAVQTEHYADLRRSQSPRGVRLSGLLAKRKINKLTPANTAGREKARFSLQPVAGKDVRICQCLR